MSFRKQFWKNVISLERYKIVHIDGTMFDMIHPPNQSINILEPNYCQSISNKEKNYLVLYLLDAVGSWQIILPMPYLEKPY